MHVVDVRGEKETEKGGKEKHTKNILVIITSNIHLSFFIILRVYLVISFRFVTSISSNKICIEAKRQTLLSAY